MDILKRIKEQKIKRLQDAKSNLPFNELRLMARDKRDTRNFKQGITRKDKEGIKLIAEIKRASPTKGIIAQDFDHVEISKIYEDSGASAISVLTEEDFFQGNLKYLRDIKQSVSKPLLRKDFIFEEYQVYESLVFDADAILLIASLLEVSQSMDLMSLAFELGLSVLYEIHDEWELEKALEINAPIIGINNRNLKTMQIDINTSLRLFSMIPKDVIKVSESGFSSRQDISIVEDVGFDAVLVGTSIMKSSDKKNMIGQLLGSI